MEDLKQSSDSVLLIILNEIMKKLDDLEKKIEEIAERETVTTQEQKVYKLKEVAELLQLGKSKTYELLQTGELKSFKVGSEYRIPARAIEEYLKKQGVS